LTTVKFAEDVADEKKNLSAATRASTGAKPGRLMATKKLVLTHHRLAWMIFE
jgi:hypothetical protein